MLVAIFLPAVIAWVEHRHSGNAALRTVFDQILPAFTFFWIILAGAIPATIASYTIVGEKAERSLESLLVTPTTDSEILVRKGLAAFLPPLAAILTGASLFMGLTDVVTRGTLGHNTFPNGDALVVVFVVVPLAVLMSIERNVIVSSRVSDVRVAQQTGMLLVLSFIRIHVSGELGLGALTAVRNLLIIAGSLLVVDAVLLVLARAAFERERILTNMEASAKVAVRRDGGIRCISGLWGWYPCCRSDGAC